MDQVHLVQRLSAIWATCERGGETVKESFPNTIYLPDRARLAINALTGLLDADKDYLPYCLVDLTGDPPRMVHTQFDYSDHTARVIDAMFLARALTGSAAGGKELDRLLELLRRGFRQDGLHYTPENPWSFEHANMHYQRSVMNALVSWHLATGDEEPRRRLEALLEGLREVAIKRDGFWYFPSVERMPDGWPRGDWKILGWGVDPANTNGRLIFGLTKAYELLGNPVALELARNFVYHVMDHSSAFLPDGSFATGMEFREGHFHSRAVTLLGVIRYAVSTGDQRALEWGKRVFDRAKEYGSSFGWFPERVVPSKAHGCETCAIVDMMESAMWLARGGYEEYWEDAERFLRNQLLESQLLSKDRLSWRVTGPAATGEWESTDSVIERSLGGFAGWSQPNDLLSKVMHDWDLYMCCCAQGVRGLFNAWTQAVTEANGIIQVNLLLNHWRDEVVIRSWLPHQGKVLVVPSKRASLEVRIPPWAPEASVRVFVNGRAASYKRRGIHAQIGKVNAGEQVEVTFDVPDSVSQEIILGRIYTVQWRGNTVVGITPKGTYIPLYERGGLKNTAVEEVEKDVVSVTFAL